MSVRSQALLGAMVASWVVALGTTPASGALQEWEVGGAQIQLSRVMMLAERISKQNLLYQLKLGEQTKDQVVATAEEMDQAIRVLYEGSPLLGVRPPPSRELRDQIDRIDAAWGPARAMALASAYDYLRRAERGRPGDPLRVLVFDERVQRVVEHAVRAQELYFEICMKQKLPACEAMRLGPATTMLSERLVKEAVLVYARLDAVENLARLAKTRAALKRTIERPHEVELVRQARSDARGVPGKVVDGMRRDIESYWATLRGDVDRVLEGDVDEFDIPLAMNTQKRLVVEFQRYTIAIVRFAAEQRARGTTWPPVAVAPLALADPSRAGLLNYEYGAAQGQLGQVQVLSERISTSSTWSRPSKKWMRSSRASARATRWVASHSLRRGRSSRSSSGSVRSGRLSGIWPSQAPSIICDSRASSSPRTTEGETPCISATSTGWRPR